MFIIQVIDLGTGYKSKPITCPNDPTLLGRIVNSLLSHEDFYHMHLDITYVEQDPLKVFDNNENDR